MLSAAGVADMFEFVVACTDDNNNANENVNFEPSTVANVLMHL